jgi:hypothetical protein
LCVVSAKNMESLILRFTVAIFTHKYTEHFFAFLFVSVLFLAPCFALNWQVVKSWVEDKVAQRSSETYQQMEHLLSVHVKLWRAQDRQVPALLYGHFIQSCGRNIIQSPYPLCVKTNNFVTFFLKLTVKLILTDNVHNLCSLVVRVLATDPEFRVRFLALPDFLCSNGSDTGSTQPSEYTEELLGRENSTSGLENLEYGRRDPSRWPRGTFYAQKLALTSPTGGGRAVGIVRSLTQATEFF